MNRWKNNISAILLVTFALTLALVSPTIVGNGLRKSSSANDDDTLREVQLPAAFFSVLSIAKALFGRVVALISSLPAALLEFLSSLFFFAWNFIAGLFLSLSVSFKTTTTTTTVTPTTTMLPLTTSPAATISSTIPADLTTASSATTGSTTLPSTSTTATLPSTSTTATLPSTSTTATLPSTSTTATLPSTSTTATLPSTSTTATLPSTSTTATLLSTSTTATLPSTSTTATVSITTGGPSKTVFVTSRRYNGNLGGLEGADAKCSELALAANLPGRFMSWISNVTHNPLNRFTKSTDPYVMLDGVTFADNFTSLTNPLVGPRVALTVQEDRQIANTTGRLDRVWSNTENDGTSSDTDCRDWTAEDSSTFGNFGSVLATDAWTIDGGFSCDREYRLYCFQQ